MGSGNSTDCVCSGSCSHVQLESPSRLLGPRPARQDVLVDSRKPIVLVAVENVLYGLNARAREDCAKILGQQPTEEEHEELAHDFPGCSASQVHQIRDSSSVIGNLTLMQGAREALDFLAESCDLFLVMSPGRSNGEEAERAAGMVRLVCRTLGKEWLSKLLITDNVAQIVADVLVDSRTNPALHSPVQVVQPVWTHMLFASPWSAKRRGVVDWSNIVRRMESVEVRVMPECLPRALGAEQKRILLIDQDNTFTDDNLQAFETATNLHHLFPVVLSPKSARVVDDFAEKDADVVQSIHQKEGFIRGLTEIHNAISTIKRLAKLYTVLLLTAPPTSDFAASEKVAWVAKHFGPDWVQRMVVTDQKMLIMGDVLIDDAPKPLGARTIEPFWTHFAFQQPWNESNQLRINWNNAHPILQEFFEHYAQDGVGKYGPFIPGPL